MGWGGAHGAAQVAQQEFKRQLPPTPEHEPWRKLLSWFLTLNFVCMCCILFRSQTFRVAWLMVKRYVGLGAAGVHTLPLWMAVLGPALLLGSGPCGELRSANASVACRWGGLPWSMAWCGRLRLARCRWDIARLFTFSFEEGCPRWRQVQVGAAGRFNCLSDPMSRVPSRSGSLWS